MNFEQLQHSLLNQMSMTFIYQPVIIKALIEADGSISVRDLARECLAYDEAQVEYYIRVVKRYPREVLTKHGVIYFDKKGFFNLALDCKALLPEERQILTELCDQKIREFIGKYKGIVGDHRYNPDELSSKSIRYIVLQMAKGRCALCGASY